MNVCNLYKLSLKGGGGEHKMEMTLFISQANSREQSSSRSPHSHRQRRNAGMLRLGASVPARSEPRPRLEHKMGGLHLPGALGVCDEAWVNWALFTVSF